MAWYDEAIFYHIYPLGLCGAPKLNENTEIEHRLPEICQWFPHIKEIGANAIYIGPLFESVGHGYETSDYYKLDRRLGDNEDLKEFVSKAHKEGIKVIFDGVFNHTGREFFAFKDLKENREKSNYKNWYCNVNFSGNNEYNDGFSYDNWGGYNLLVKLNQWNEEVRNYIYDVIRFWVKEFDVDGIRLDAADVMEKEFLKGIRKVANEVKDDFWLMGEVIHGQYNEWVNPDTLHSVTNYNLNKALWSGLNDKNFFEIAHTVKRLYEMGACKYKNLQLYNFADNHDVDRIVNKLSIKENLYPLYTMVYTLPGIPSIYYGSEFAIQGKKDKGSDDPLRPCLDIKDYENAIENNACTAFIAKLGKIRKKIHALNYGEYKEILLQNKLYVFERYSDRDRAIVILNNDEKNGEFSFEIGDVKKDKIKGEFAKKEYEICEGKISGEIGANQVEIIWIKN